MTEIYIDGILMDADDKVGKIAVTYQNFVFLSLDKVKASHTNRISLPLTTNNKLKLKQMAPLSAISTVPYVNHDIRIVQGGIEIIPSGVCQITGVQDRIEIDVQSGIKGFWDALEGKYLNDLDLTSWNGLWDNDRHDTVRNTTSGLVCPVVNTGQLVDMTTYVDGHTYGTAMIPFFYYHTIMTQIFALAGFSKAGAIFSDTKRYSKMVMSTRLVYNSIWLRKKEFTATKNSDSIGVGTHTIDDFDIVIDNEDGFFINSNGRYSITNVDTSAKYFRGVLTFTTILSPTHNITVAIFRKNGATNVTASSNINNNILTIVSNAIEFQNGDYIEIRLTTLGTSGMTNLKLTIKTANTTDTDRIQATDWHWYFNQLLPRILLKDFIKDFMRMFGLVMSEKNNTVTFKTIEEVLTGIAPTTTELLKENKKNRMDINYNPSGWAQENNYYWIVQETETVITEDYGRGQILIDNETLPVTREVYTSLFTASDQVTEKRINQAAQITIYNQATPAFTKAASFGSRLVLLRDDDGVNFRFTAGTSRTDYFIGYFIDKNQTYNLDFQELINSYYGTYEEVLNNYAAVEQEFLISQVQAVNMDLLITKHKQGITYLVEQVSSFVPGKFAKFKMIRILIGS